MPIQRFLSSTKSNKGLLHSDLMKHIKAKECSKFNSKSPCTENNHQEQFEVNIMSGSLSVNGIFYTKAGEESAVNSNAAMINLPIERRIYIDQLKGTDALIIVESGELLISGILLKEAQIAFTSGLEQFVISAQVPNTSAKVISLVA